MSHERGEWFESFFGFNLRNVMLLRNYGSLKGRVRRHRTKLATWVNSNSQKPMDAVGRVSLIIGQVLLMKLRVCCSNGSLGKLVRQMYRSLERGLGVERGSEQ